MKWLAALVMMLLSLPAFSAERTPVAIELVLALDSSASVNGEEFLLQLNGLALAFQDPEILKAFENLKPLGAAVSVIQWGGPGETRTVVPFTHIQNGRDSKAFGFVTGLVRRWMRASSTSIATAIDDGTNLLESNEFDGGRLVIDISGDGPDNSAVNIEAARAKAQAARVTINGLPIENEDALLSAYYRDHVILGEGSFIETAADYDDFARAILEKLRRELRPLGY